MSIDEYFDLYKLSELLKVQSLQIILQKYAKDHLNDIDFIINIILKQNLLNADYNIFLNDNISIDYEEILQDKVEECLLNKKFGELPFSIIYRIIEKGKSNLSSCDSLYDFISCSIEDRCSLFHFVDLDKLYDSKFDELYNNYQKYTQNSLCYQYLSNNLTYINSLINDKKELEKRMKEKIKELEKEKNEMQVHLKNDFHQQINESDTKFQMKINELTTSNNDLKKKIKEFSEQNSKQNERINELTKQIESLNNTISFPYSSDDAFNGIMRYLTRITHGNIHDNGIIEITSNSIHDDSEHPKNLVDYQENNYYASKDNGGAIICFDFKEKYVNLQSYSIKSYNYGKDFTNLRNWVIEVSNNNQNWEEIDRHENDPTLNGASVIANFTINKQNNYFYRFIRLRQTGPSWNTRDRHNYIWFPLIEFYGILKIK